MHSRAVRFWARGLSGSFGYAVARRVCKFTTLWFVAHTNFKMMARSNGRCGPRCARLHPLPVAMTFLLMLSLSGAEARLSVDDPHNRELHGECVCWIKCSSAAALLYNVSAFVRGVRCILNVRSALSRARTCARWRSRIGHSVRHLAERMATDPRTGLGILTDDDVALLFLRYQREFNRHT